MKISLNFVGKCPINCIPALVQIMAWRWPGDKPLSEPMLIRFSEAYMRHWGGSGWGSAGVNTNCMGLILGISGVPVFHQANETLVDTMLTKI